MLASLDWLKIIERLQSYATSDTGKEFISRTEPLSSPEEAEDSFKNIFSAEEVIAKGQRPFMESLDLFSTWSNRLEKKAVLTTLELKDVRHFCIETIALSEVLLNCESDWSTTTQKRLFKSDESLSAIDQVMTPDGAIKTDASELLYKLTGEKKQLIQQVQKTLDRLVKTFEMEPILQDKYVTNREGRWVLPIKSGMQSQFEGIIHASSHSKQTVFMEPQEIIPLNNRLREVGVEIDKEVERLLTELSHYLSLHLNEFIETRGVLLECDVLFAKARMSNALQSSAVQFDSRSIQLNDLRNPVLLLNNEKVISNDVHLDSSNRILILSGPNAGGKTVLLKSIGLAAHMARCGLPICTSPESKIPFFKQIHIGVGDAQSVDENLSTFAAHLIVLDKASQTKGSDTLLLIDEICGSTDPEEGSALARSFINSYARNEVFAVITSHLGGLKKNWEDTPGVVNGSLEFDKEKGPTYQFLLGIPGQSLAIQTARRVGVRGEIVDQALQFLSPEHRKYQEDLKQIERMKEELIKVRKDLQTEKELAQKQKSKYEALALQLQKEKAKVLDETKVAAEKKIEELIAQARVEDTFKKHEQLQKIKKEMPNIVKAPSQGSTIQTFKIESADEFTKKFPPGSKVFVPQLNSDAVVQGRPSQKGEIPILSNSMRLMIYWEDLKPAQKADNPTQDLLRKTQHYQSAVSESDRVLDLRGCTIEEATQKLELQLDNSALNGEDRLKIVHGHGTDALKRSLRSYLSRSVYVKKWTAGTPESGGDGITWVEIKD